MREEVHLLHYWAVVRRRWLLIVTVPCLVVLGVIFTVFRQPNVYRAQTKIRVEMEQPEVMFYPSLPFIAPHDSQRFYRTQNQIIQSNPILGTVVKELDLGERWFPGRPDADNLALARLRQNLRVTPVEGSTIINIAYDDQDRFQAAEVADAVVIHFVIQRKKVRGIFLEEVIENMRHQLDVNRQKLDRSEIALHRFKVEKGLTFIQDRPLDEERLAELNDIYIKAKTRRMVREVQLADLEEMPPNERISSLVLMSDNRHFQDLRAMLDTNEVELATLEQKYQPRHPEVLEVRARISKIESQLQELSKGMLNGIKSEYEKALKEEQLLASALGEIRLEDQLKEESIAEYLGLKRQLEVDQEVVLTTSKRMEEAMVGESIPKVRIEVIEYAAVPEFPVKPKRLLSLILGGVLGMGAGLALAFFLSYLNQRLVSIEEVERYLHLPVLALIPRNTPSLAREPDNFVALEPYRLLRANIHHKCLQEDVKTILITSAAAGEGKSTTAANLAICMAKLGDQVLLVDADCRRPTIDTVLGLTKEPGLIDLLAGQVGLADVIQKSGKDLTLDVVTSGNDSEKGISLLNSRGLGDMIKEVRDLYELVLFDSPLVLGVSDTLYLASAVDAVILLVEHNRHARSVVLQAKNQLEATGARIIGVVFNNISPHDIRYYAHYYYLGGE
jgi:polysaccharide biosynthesis transport protein